VLSVADLTVGVVVFGDDEDGHGEIRYGIG
jgi:hypothetical protein